MIGCDVPLTPVPGTDANVVMSPIDPGSRYTDYTDELLYEIWKTLQLLTPVMETKPISFDVGDGQVGSPVDGDTQLHLATIQGQSLVNINLLVVREGIALRYSTPVPAIKDIKRFNSGGLGGFTFEPASGLKFNAGEHYDIYVVGSNASIAP